MKKKIIAVLTIVSFCVASTFAFGLGAGVKGNLGWNIAADKSISESFSGITADSAFDFGGGAYVYLSFIPFLGVQAEVNLISSSVTFNGTMAGETPQKYQQLLLDMTPYLWSVYDFSIFQLAFGVGPNFSIRLNELGDIKNVTSINDFNIGLAAGADFKIFFGDHFGIVLGGRFICDFDKATKELIINGSTPSSFDITLPRRSFYGSIGVELKV